MYNYLHIHRPHIAREYGTAFEVRHKLLSLSGSDAGPKEFAPFLMTLFFKKYQSSEVFAFLENSSPAKSISIIMLAGFSKLCFFHALLNIVAHCVFWKNAILDGCSTVG